MKVTGRSLGGFVENPPKDRSWFDGFLGTEMNDEAWTKICEAYGAYGHRLRELVVSKAAKGKNNPESWFTRQKLIVASLERALNSIDSATDSKHGNFIEEASRNYRASELGYSASRKLKTRAKLDSAYKDILDCRTIIDRANPEIRDVASSAESRKLLARDLFRGMGKPALSDGRVVSDEAAESDLTPFEQLISVLEIHETVTPSALWRWIRQAVKLK